MASKHIAFRNPFRYKGSLDPVEDRVVFISRSDLVRRMLSGIRDGTWFTIIGGKKVGKTSLVNELIHQGQTVLPNHEFLLAKMKDIGCTDAAGLYGEVADRFCAPLLRSKREFGYVHGSVSSTTDFKNLLVRLAHEYEDKDGIVLFLDGIEAVPTELLVPLLKMLGVIHSTRTSVPEFGRFRVIVSGAVHPVDIADLSAGAYSEVSQVVVLQDFVEDEIEDMVKRVLNDTGIEFDEGAPRLLVEETGGTAYLAQKICFDILEDSAKKGKRPGFSTRDVTAAINSVIERGEANLMWTVSSIERDPSLVEVLLSLLERTKVEGVSFDRDLRRLEVLGAVKRVGDAALIRNRIYARAFRNRFTPERVAELLFDAKRYAKARVFYRKAIQECIRGMGTLRAGFETARDVSGDPELGRVFYNILGRAREIGEAQLCSIMVLDGRTGTLSMAAHHGYDDAYLGAFSLELGQGVAGRVAKTGSKRIVSDVQDRSQCPEFAYPDMPKKKGVHAFACVPLRFRQEILGVLNTYLGGDAQFSLDDIARLETLAGQAAVALKTSQLREEADRLGGALRQKADDLDMILETTIKTASLDAETMLGYVLRTCRMVAKTDRVFICYRDPRTDDFKHALHEAISKDKVKFADVSKGEGLSGQVLIDGKERYCPDVSMGCDHYHEVWPDTKSDFATPLLAAVSGVAREVIGVLNVESTRVDAFDEHQRRLLSALAVEAGVALKKAALHEVLKKRTEQVLSLGRIDERIISTGSFAETLDSIGRESLARVGRGDRHFFILVKHRQGLLIKAEGGLTLARGYTGFQIPLTGVDGRSLAVKALRDSAVVVCNDVRNGPNAEHYLEVAPVFRAAIVAPMIFENEAIGVIDIESTEPDAFDEEDSYWLRVLADKAAIACKMKEEREIHAKHLAVLSQVNHEVVSNPLSASILSTIVDQTASAIGHQDRRVYYIELLDEAKQKLAIRYASGLDALKRDYMDKTYVRGEKNIGWHTIGTRQPYLCPDVDRDDHYARINRDIKSNLSAPIYFCDEPLGVIGVESLERDDFGEHDVRLLRDLADSAGAAIKIAGLTEETVRSQNWMHRAILYDQIRDISHDIRTGGFVIISHTDSIGGAVQAASFEVADVLRRLGIIRQEAANVNQMAVDLKAPAAPPRLELHDVNLVVREAADALECKAVPKKVAIARDLWSADLVCQIDAGRIARAFKNIIKNAIEALQPGGLVRIRTAPVATGGWVEVVVEDNGPGIPVSLLARLKRGLPVDSDKPEGTGIGFASAKSTVEKDHGGRVEIDSEEGRGTKVTISFPTQAADGIGGNTT